MAQNSHQKSENCLKNRAKNCLDFCAKSVRLYGIIRTVRIHTVQPPTAEKYFGQKFTEFFYRESCRLCCSLSSLKHAHVLIKAVLEIQLVYWLALAHIPATVLNRIRKLVFSFLWSGNKKTSTFHLCNWETISKPKVFGGWGLRNIFCFSRALAAKSLWRGLMHPGIWQRVLKDKYFPHISVTTWLRSALPVSSFGSQTWKNLLNSLPLIVHWLAWKPGAGDSIITGKDEILGMGKDSFLSAELITCLNRKNVYFLFQASRAYTRGRSAPIGLTTQIWDWRVTMLLNGTGTG
jgi:hypothetical protein